MISFRVLGSVIALACFCPVPSFAAKPASNQVFRIVKVSKQVWNGYVNVDHSWQTSVKTLRISLRVEEDLGKVNPYCRVYFFDKDRKQVAVLASPNMVQKGGRYESMPDYLKPKTTYEVYFAIPEKASDWGSRWETAVIVFGDGNRFATEVYPSANVTVQDFDFNEKSQVMAGSGG